MLYLVVWFGLYVRDSVLGREIVDGRINGDDMVDELVRKTGRFSIRPRGDVQKVFDSREFSNFKSNKTEMFVETAVNSSMYKSLFDVLESSIKDDVEEAKSMTRISFGNEYTESINLLSKIKETRSNVRSLLAFIRRVF